MALRVLRTPEEWAQDKLERGGIDSAAVHRVFAPMDEIWDTSHEVLYLDSRNRPFKAFIEPSGRIVTTISGW